MSKITVLKVQTVKPVGKKYQKCDLGYKNDEGKVKGMGILDFAQPEVFKVASTAKEGDVLEAQFEQNEKGYWQFRSLENTGTTGDSSVPATPSVAAGTGANKGGNWETTAERAARQVMIVRQSSCSTAVAALSVGATEPVVLDDVLMFAKGIENFVMGRGDVE